MVSAALAQAGAIRAEDTDDLALAVDATRLPPVTGPRVALLSRSGGHGVIATDACARAGVQLPPFSSDLLRDLAAIQPDTVIERGNPLDFGDVFDFERMELIADRICREDDLDGMVLVLLNGTINRVMIVELGIPAWMVALLVALPIVFAPLRLDPGLPSTADRGFLLPCTIASQHPPRDRAHDRSGDEQGNVGGVDLGHAAFLYEASRSASNTAMTSLICCSAQSISALPMTSGGARRTTVSCVSLLRRPRSIRASRLSSGADWSDAQAPIWLFRSRVEK